MITPGEIIIGQELQQEQLPRNLIKYLTITQLVTTYRRIEPPGKGQHPNDKQTLRKKGDPLSSSLFLRFFFEKCYQGSWQGVRHQPIWTQLPNGDNDVKSESKDARVNHKTSRPGQRDKAEDRTSAGGTSLQDSRQAGRQPGRPLIC